MFGRATITLGNGPHSSFFCFFCMVTDFSVAKEDNSVKLCMIVRLLWGQVVFHFGELWLAWSHGGGIKLTSGMSYM